MKNFFSAVVAVALLAVAGCQSADPMADPRLTDEDVEARTANSAPDHPKGMGGVNGMSSYCNNPGALCANGEGDCDATSQCQAGLTCVPNQGPRFGLGSSVDVCMPATCANRRLDPGEVIADCGGGGCPACTSGLAIGTKGSMGATNGNQNYCNDQNNPCAWGEGDCDLSSQCQAGLACIPGAGAKVGLASNVDVCLPSTCFNRVLDIGEVVADCGGTCPSCSQIGGAKGAFDAAPGLANFCVDPAHLCSIGEGNCRNDAQCEMGLKCTGSAGAKFGFTVGTNICLPPACSNRVRDPGEASVDCGGSSGCGLCPVGAASCLDGVRNGHETGVDCGGVCDPCVVSAATCNDGIKNGNETGIDCGGVCDSCGACTNVAGFRDGDFSSDHGQWQFHLGAFYSPAMGDMDLGKLTSIANGNASQLNVCKPAGVNAVLIYGANYEDVYWQVAAYAQANPWQINNTATYGPITICLGSIPQFDFYLGDTASGATFDNVSFTNSGSCPVSGQINNNSFDDGGTNWVSHTVTFTSGDAIIDGANCGQGDLTNWVNIPVDAVHPAIVVHYDSTLNSDDTVYYDWRIGQEQGPDAQDETSATFCPGTQVNGQALLVGMHAAAVGTCGTTSGQMVIHDVQYLDDSTLCP